MFYLRANLLVAPVSFFLSENQRITPFAFIQNAIVPDLITGDLLETVAGVGFIVKQAAHIHAIMAFPRGVGHGIAKIVRVTFFVESASVSICGEWSVEWVNYVNAGHSAGLAGAEEDFYHQWWNRI
jgi:hypothetical protein